MDLRLTIQGSDADELGQLREWLGREPDLRGRVKVRTRQPEPEAMGAFGDALVVAVGSGGALSVLFASL